MDQYALAYLTGRGILPAVAERSGCTFDHSRTALRIPYYDAKGREVWARWRFLKPGADPRYLPTAAGPGHLYNVIDSQKPLIFLTEGEIDTLSLLSYIQQMEPSRSSGVGIVGVPGANSFKTQWRWLFVNSVVN